MLVAASVLFASFVARPAFALGPSNPSLPAPNALSATDRAALHDSLLARFDDQNNDGGCQTGLVMDLTANWDVFTPAERARITGVLAPFKRDLVDPLPSTTTAGEPPPPPSGTPTSTCFSQQGDTVLTGTHFQVQWDSGSVSQTIAQGFLDDLEFAYTAEVEQHGWKDFNGDGQYLMLAYIENQNTGGAYTTVSQCGNFYMPYIVAGKDAVNYGTWTQEMAAHEFNHSLQFAYSYAPEFWWWEATATYVQSVVRSTYNWADYLSGYTDYPYIAMSASSQSDQTTFLHMYGLSIFGHYLSDYQGGEAAVRETWENASRSHSAQYGLSMKDMVSGLGLDFQTIFIDFITKNVCMDYTQHSHYPSISIEGHYNNFPSSGASSSKTRPQGYGENYMRFDGGSASGDLTVNFTGDTSVDWVLVLAETDGKNVLNSVSAVAPAGVGSVTFPGFGANDVYLVVAPLDTAETKHDYSWTADVASDAAADSGVLDTSTNGDSGGPHGGKHNAGQVGGCGCANAAGGGEAGLMLAMVGLVVGRRRRR